MSRALRLTGKVELVNQYNLRTASNGRKAFSFQHFPSITADAYLFARVRAVSADVPNKNGDCFPYDELKKSYHSFIGRPVCCDHKSSAVDDVYGLILDATWVENEGHGAWVELLLAVDRSHDSLCRKIESGQITDVSMGCLVKEGICSVCGNSCKGTQDEYGQISDMCEHVKYYKGSVYQGKEVFENCHGVEFIEISWVTDGADNDAIVLDVNIKPNTNLPEDVVVSLNSKSEGLKKVASFKKFARQNVLVSHLDDKQGAALFEACRFVRPNDYMRLFSQLQTYKVREAYQELLKEAKDDKRVVKALMDSDDSSRYDYVLTEDDVTRIREFAYDGLSHINESENWALSEKLIAYTFGKLEEWVSQDEYMSILRDPNQLVNREVEFVLRDFRKSVASTKRLKSAAMISDLSVLHPGETVTITDAEYGLKGAIGIVHSVAETSLVGETVDWVQVFIQEPTSQIVVIYQEDVSVGVSVVKI